MQPSMQALWDAYTAEVLAWELGTAEAAAVTEDAETARRTAARTARAAAAGGRSWVLLLGAGDGTLAGLLREHLPTECGLLVLESHMPTARRFRERQPKLALLADTSPWALLLLTAGCGLAADACALCRNPASDRREQGLEMWRKLFLGAQWRELGAADAPSLSVGCILHPEEPGLEDFFAQVPPWVREVGVVWDAAAPARVPACPVPLRQRVRALEHDFAAQRNAMLELCGGEWCLYLDADERLAPEAWEALPRLLSLPEMGGGLFPRLTFEGDEQHGRMGYGLWPDVQLRLFRRTPEIRFSGKVHEKVLGVPDRLGWAVGMPLLHYSHTRKDGAALAERLTVFNAAGGPEHTLSPVYPRLPRDLLELPGRLHAGEILLLPSMN